MTNNLITLTIPNDDHVALRAFGKALEEMALAHGAEPRKTTVEMTYKLNIDTTEATAALEELRQQHQFPGNCLTDHGKREAPEVENTAQQVESLSQNDEEKPMTDDELDDFCPAPTTDSSGTPWDERIHSASKALNSDGTWRLRRKPKDMDEVEWLQLIADVKLELSGEEQYDQEELTRQMNDLSERYDGVDVDPAHEKGDETAELTIEPPVTPPGDDFHTDAGVVTEQTVAGIPPIPVPPPVVNEWQNEVTHPQNGDLCSVCMKPQFSSPGGVTCENGHGGAPAYEKPVPPPLVVAPPVADDTAWDFPKLMKFLTERHGKIDVTTVNSLLAADGIASLQELNANPDKIGPFVARVKVHLGE